MASEATVKWLGEGYPPPEAPAARTPHLKNFLIDLHVLEKDGEEPKLLGGTPPSLQVITAGGTSLAKWWTGLAGAGLGGGALVQALRAVDWWPGKNLDELQQAVLTASAAVMASVAVVAIAIIVRADVSARAVASAAEYQARAAIATALIDSFQYEAAPQAPVAPEPKHLVRTKRDEWAAVQQFEWVDGRLVARVDEKTIIPAAEIAWVTPTGVWNGAK